MLNILFVNDKTLFNFLVPDVSRSQIRKLDSLFKGYLECVLSEEGFSKAVKTRIMEECQEIEYSNTNSKSVLGSMNDLAFHYKYHMLSEGGVHSSALPSIIKKLNHMPMGALEYSFPIEALKAMYKKYWNTQNTAHPSGRDALQGFHARLRADYKKAC